MLEKIMIKEVIAPILIILFSVLVYVVLKAMVKRLFKLKIKQLAPRKQKALVGLINTVLKVFIFLVALMMILDVFGIDTKSLVTSLGVASLVIGLALQDLIKDFVVGLTVLIEDQYSVGDVVTINNFTGTVVYMGLKTTRIKAFTGEVRIISNRSIIEVSNHTLEMNKIVVDVKVKYDSDAQRVKEQLSILCEELSEELSLPEKAQCVGIESMDGTNGMLFQIIITAKFSDKASIARTFRERIKDVLDKEKVSIAYPQMVIRNG